MAKGYHHFFVYTIGRSNHMENKEDYFIGGFIGDTYSSETFKEKMDKICRKLQQKFGLSNYIYCWSPVNLKPYTPRTTIQRYQTAVKKSKNKTNRRIAEIKGQNFLFADTFIEEEREKLVERIEVLKKRYNRIK